MRLLFAGTPELAVPALRMLATTHEVCALLTAPDAPSGRGGKVVPSPAKAAATELGIPILQPERLDRAFRDEVRALEPDLLVVVAFGRIFGDKSLALFPRGALNLHPSLLPRHRGPTPITATILCGDTEAGVTVQRVAAAVDSGNILAQARVPLDGTETTSSLAQRLAPIGARLLHEVVDALGRGAAAEVEQDHSSATYCHKLAREDGLIRWDEAAAAIARKVRAFDAFPGTYTSFGDRHLHILEAAVVDECSVAGLASGPSVAPGLALSPSVAGLASAPSVAPGVVLGADKRYGILVSTGKGLLCVRRLQLEARKALDWRSFLNGVPGFVGSRLGGSAHASTVDSAASHH